MIFLEFMTAARLAKRDLTATLITTFGVDLTLIDDIRELDSVRSSCLFDRVHGDFVGHAQVFVSDDESIELHTGEAVLELARRTSFPILLPDDDSSNPYQFIRLDADGRRTTYLANADDSTARTPIGETIRCQRSPRCLIRPSRAADSGVVLRMTVTEYRTADR